MRALGFGTVWWTVNVARRSRVHLDEVDTVGSAEPLQSVAPDHVWVGQVGNDDGALAVGGREVLRVERQVQGRGSLDELAVENGLRSRKENPRGLWNPRPPARQPGHCHIPTLKS
jgi:hypothetical protein